MTLSTTRLRLGAGLLGGLLLLGACGNDGAEPAATSTSKEFSVVDIADLPDIEQTRTQMLGLIESVRAEVAREVPATEPWQWNRTEGNAGCVQPETGRSGVALYLRNLVSAHGLTDAEWDQVFPAVQRLAAEAGLTKVWAPHSRDVRFISDDGREMSFGAAAATVISGTITCRRPAGTPPKGATE